MNKHSKKSDWKRTLKEIRSEYRTVSRPCLAMSTDRFNKLMREYKIIKPQWSYQKRKKYLQFIIDQSEERQVVSRDIIYSTNSKKRYFIALGRDCKRGSHHCLSWLDDTFDKLLDDMIGMDIL